MTAAGGFIYYYGISPWFNCLEDKEISLSPLTFLLISSLERLKIV